MEGKIVTNSQYKSLMIMFILGTSLLFVGNIHGEEDLWISILIAIAMAVPLGLVYCKIVKLFPGMGFFDILPKAYGKVLGKFFILSYSCYFFILGILDIRNTTEYVQVVSLPETPQYVTAIFMGLLIAYTINAGFSVFSTWAKIILPIITLLIITTIVLGLSQFNFSYLKPVLYNGWKPVLSNSYSLLIFPFGETVIFLVFANYFKNSKDSTKIYISSIIIGGLILLINVLRNMLLLGFPNANIIFFKSHYATSIIRLSEFIQRIEIIVSSNLILTSFSKAAVSTYATSIGVIKLFNIKKTKIVSTIVCTLVIIVSLFFFKSTMTMSEFIQYYNFLVIPFQFLIPILTLIIGSIRK